MRSVLKVTVRILLLPLALIGVTLFALLVFAQPQAAQRIIDNIQPGNCPMKEG